MFLKTSTGENKRDRLRYPKLVSELTENTLSMQGITVTGSLLCIKSSLTKIRSQENVSFTGCKLQRNKAYLCHEEWYYKKFQKILSDFGVPRELSSATKKNFFDILRETIPLNH